MSSSRCKHGFDESASRALDNKTSTFQHQDVRTTLTLDDDVAARLKALVRIGGPSFRTVVNEVLRAGLSAIENESGIRAQHRTVGFNLGPSLVGSLDNVEEGLVRSENQHH